jgi:plasmid stability protein
MPNGSEKSQIGVWIDDDLRERVEAAAAREGRSLSGFVRNLLRRQIEVERRLYEPADLQAHQS